MDWSLQPFEHLHLPVSQVVSMHLLAAIAWGKPSQFSTIFVERRKAMRSAKIVLVASLVTFKWFAQYYGLLEIPVFSAAFGGCKRWTHLRSLNDWIVR